jgi:membrane protease YdiL (CAAX protease family)
MFQKLLSRINAPEAAPPWNVLVALFTVIVAFVAIIIGTTIALLLLDQTQYTALASWTIGAAITVAFIFTRFRTPEERAALRLNLAGDTLPVQQLFLMLLIGVGLAVALDVVSGRVTNSFAPDPELYPLYLDASVGGFPVLVVSWLLALVFMVIAQPVAEELVFRGVLLPSLRATIGAWPGYILSALLYAVFHLMAFSPSPNDFRGLWYGQILPFIAGLIFGAVRLYTGSTRAAILAHVGFGLFAVVKLVTLVG